MEDLDDQFRGFRARARIVGQAPEFLRAVDKLPAIASSDAAVFILGESGTGKELIARAIHYLSERAPFAFVAVNCGSFPDTLFESEFFGHERGAFTNAHARRDGLVAQANGGTLFLDEIDNLPMKAQIDMLRVLQEKKFRALGSNSERESNVRFVAASNARIGALIDSGNFRTDLFYRLSVFTVVLPPLRNRMEDILPLANHFLIKHCPTSRTLPALSGEASHLLLAYHWPGNIRELENAIIRGVFLSQTGVIGVKDLGMDTEMLITTDPDSQRSFKAAKQQAMHTFERVYLDRLMAAHQGNITQAARAAGKDRRELGKLLKKHRVDAKLFNMGRGGAA